jgi:hypothetical protein
MPPLRTYKVFISHAWHRSAEYHRVVQFLDETSNFRWENLSVPEHSPMSGSDLDYEVRNQMRPADVFVIIAGMYVAHSGWIDFELAFARRIGRPIIGVWRRGGERMPRAVRLAAVDVVGWNGASIVRAIRQYALPSGA